MSIFIPRKKEFWQQKPAGSIRVNLSHPIFDGIANGGDFVDCSVLGQSGLIHELNNPERPGSSGTEKPSEYGAAINYSGIANDGSLLDLDLTAASQLSIVSVVKLSHYLSNLDEQSFYRWASLESAGVSLSVMSTGKIRGLIYTSGGTGIWTVAQDTAAIVPLDVWYIIAFSWDGSTRTIYSGPVGGEIIARRTDVCTGTVSSQASALSVVNGGLHPSSQGSGDSLYTLVKKAPVSLDALNLLSQNVTGVYEPCQSYGVLPTAAGTAPIMASALRGA